MLLSETVKWIFLNTDELEAMLKSYEFVQKFRDENIVFEINKVYQELIWFDFFLHFALY